MPAIGSDASTFPAQDDALDDSRAWYRAVFAQTREALCLVDPRTLGLLSANPAFCRITGYGPGEIRGLTLFDFIAHDPQSIEEHLEACRSQGEVWAGIRRWRRKDGHIRFVDTHKKLIAYGRTQAVCIASQDVTDRIRFERQLELNAASLARQNRQLAVLQAMNRAISANLSLSDLLATLGRELSPSLAVDAITIIRQAGSPKPVVEANWPRTDASVVGTSLGLVGPQDHPLLQLAGPVTLDGPTLEAIGARYPSFREGGIRSLMLAPLFLHEERYGMLALSSRRENAFGPDATALLSWIGPQIDVALANIAAVRSLEEVARLKSEFVAVASHELRTPVAVAVGYARMLASPEFPVTAQEQHTYLTRLSDACDRLSALVEHLLDMSRIEEGKLALELEPVSARQAFDEIGPLLAARYPDRPSLRIEGEAILNADRSALERVALNLLDNAYKYGPPSESPRVQIRAAAAPGRVRVQVCNRGTLSAEEQGRLFGRFSRLARHRAVPGTGIGLFASRAAIVQMGGSMGVESRDGEVVFWFELPAAGAEPPFLAESKPSSRSR